MSFVSFRSPGAALAAAFVLTWTPAATACSCGCFGFAPFEWSLAYADLVVGGKVLRTTPFDGPEPITRYFEVELEVSAVWKGPVSSRVVIYTPADDFSCAVPFAAEGEYIVYATEGELIPGRFGTILCDRTQPFRPEELDFLGAPCFEGSAVAANEGATCKGLGPEEPPTPFPPCFLFLRGDVDLGGKVELTDAVVLLGWLFLGTQAPGCEDAADANDDGELNLGDPVSILNFLFLGAAPLPPPGPQLCEGDPTDDRLACATGTNCPFEE